MVRVYNILEDSKRIYVISEFLKGTELQKRVIAQNTLFEEKNALLITRKIADALLAYLEVGLIYLDLRCEKILFINESLNSLDIKLVDNGTSVPYLPGQNLNLDQLNYQFTVSTFKCSASKFLRTHCSARQSSTHAESSMRKVWYGV